MNFRGMAFLAGTTLALLNIPACGARGSGGNTIITETDSGTAPVDSGTAPVDSGTAPMCSAPRMTCGTSCIDITGDVFNCGACGRRCGDGQTCTASQCVGGTPTCPSPMRLCATRCIDVSSDPANCGTCGRVCASGTTCTGGICAAIATGIAASGSCSGTTCGPAGELQCATALAGGGFCTAFCNTGTTTEEQGQCGGAGSTCVANPPFADILAGQGMCLRACNPAATREATGGCRSGLVCTGFWYTVAEGGAQDSPGCFPFCTSDAQCAGAVAGDAGIPRCNVRTGRCSSAPTDLALTSDGDACNPSLVMSSGRSACRGTCFRLGPDATQGVCGSYLNLAVGPNCPDNPAFVRPLSRGNDNLAICVFKTCLHNSECGSPLRCLYTESVGTIRSELPASCTYVTALQPDGLP